MRFGNPSRALTEQTRRTAALRPTGPEFSLPQQGVFKQEIKMAEATGTSNVDWLINRRRAHILDPVSCMSAWLHAWSNIFFTSAASDVLPCASRLWISPNIDQPLWG